MDECIKRFPPFDNTLPKGRYYRKMGKEWDCRDLAESFFINHKWGYDDPTNDNRLICIFGPLPDPRKLGL